MEPPVNPVLGLQVQVQNPNVKSILVGFSKNTIRRFTLAGFKEYVADIVQTSKDISLAYIDSEDDEIPIGSELEFREFFTNAQKRAKNGQHQVVLKIYHAKKIQSAKKDKNIRKKIKVKVHKTKERDDCCSCSSSDEKKAKSFGDGDETPKWFKKYMKEFKEELVAEVTSNVLVTVKDAIKEKKHLEKTSDLLGTKLLSKPSHQPTGWAEVKKKYEEDQTDNVGLATDQSFRDLKLFKKMEKLHKKGEKKLEKLDSKLEKLENKTKRLLEKKSRSDKSEKQGEEQTIKKLHRSTHKLTKIPKSTYLMDATVFEKGYAYAKPGEQFSKHFWVMNTGTLPWTEKTEIRLAWGTPGLFFETNVMKCPIIKPGERGVVTVLCIAPNYCGTYDSYWHFYHMGERFGHWIDCSVIVENYDKSVKEVKQQKEEEVKEEEEEYLELGVKENIQRSISKIRELQKNIKELDKLKETIVSRSEINNKDNEIEKRLDDLNLIPPPPNATEILKMAFGEEYEVTMTEPAEFDEWADLSQLTGENVEPDEWKSLQNHPAFLRSCMRLQHDLDGKFENLSLDEKEKPGDPNVMLINFESTHEDVPEQYFDASINLNEQPSFSKMECTEKVSQLLEDKKKKNAEYESDTDSELSVISGVSSTTSEDDDSNFIVVSMPETAEENNCELCKSMEGVGEAAAQDPQPTEPQKEELKVINAPESKEEEIFKVEINETTESENNDEPPQPECTVGPAVHSGISGLEIRSRDAEGQPIYAVSSEGHCVRVECMLNSQKPAEQFFRPRRFGDFDKPESKSKKMKCSVEGLEDCYKPPQQEETHKHRSGASQPGYSFRAHHNGYSFKPYSFKKENSDKHASSPGGLPYHFPGGSALPSWSTGRVHPPTVDILPNALMNGAISAATTAFTTARSVITNIQSALLPEVDKPTSPKKRVSEESMFALYEMGFDDFFLNSHLLEYYDNDLSKVVETLLMCDKTKKRK